MDEVAARSLLIFVHVLHFCAGRASKKGGPDGVQLCICVYIYELWSELWILGPYKRGTWDSAWGLYHVPY